MARLDALVIGRQGEVARQQRMAFGLGEFELAEQDLGIGVLEIIG